MKKVYIVIEDCYDETSILEVFSSRKKAVEWCNLYYVQDTKYPIDTMWRCGNTYIYIQDKKIY